MSSKGTPSQSRHIQKILAENIKAFRAKLNLSQMDLAQRADLSAGHMNDIEGQRRWVSAESLERIASALHVPVYQLFLERPDELTERNEFLTDLLARLKPSVIATLEETIFAKTTLATKKTRRSPK